MLGSRVVLAAGSAAVFGALFGCYDFTLPAGTSSGVPPGGTDAGPDASTETTVVGTASASFIDVTRTTVTVAAVPGTRRGDLLYAVVAWLSRTSASFVVPEGWKLEESLNDGFEGRAVSLVRAVGDADAATEFAFPLPVEAPAGALLIAYRGVHPLPQHRVVGRAQNINTNEADVLVPGVSVPAEGRLLLVVVSTYSPPNRPRIAPELDVLVSAGRLYAFEAHVREGRTNDYAITDGFFALRSTLTFLNVFRRGP